MADAVSSSKALDDELNRLLLKKAALEAQLQRKPLTNVRSMIYKNAANLKSKVKSEDWKTRTGTKLFQNAAERVHRRKLHSIYLSYRLCGRSVFRLNDPVSGENLIGIRFDTSFKGKFYEKYYVFLRNDLSTKALALHKHTMPPFIAIESIAKKFLNENVRSFTEAVGDLLQSYVNRRENCKIICAGVGTTIKVESFTASDGYDLVSFRLAGMQNSGSFSGDRFLEVKLAYDDLACVLPSRVECAWILPDGTYSPVDSMIEEVRSRLRSEDLPTLIQRLEEDGLSSRSLRIS